MSKTGRFYLAVNKDGLYVKVLARNLQEAKNYAQNEFIERNLYSKNLHVTPILNTRNLNHADTYIKNPARKKTKVKKVRTPEKQYTDFHHKTGANITTDLINYPDTVIHLGKAIGVVYGSDKFDGKYRVYIHRFKTHGNCLMKPESKVTGFSDMIIFSKLKCKITKRGITG